MILPSHFSSPAFGFAGTSQAVQSAIAYDQMLDGSKFTVVESGGVLYLDGFAPSQDTVERALAIARSVSACRVVSRVLPANSEFALLKS
ncbi:BON domain-containing protein [Rhizobium ruizarguesonis]|uniref:BON domain-containing protein n=1 Tax=Rhizobium ruizarguesonis TaxID=2081791 RepID=UPI0013C180A2|nr:BON domain-containing protein [Rhizobium ruizarguesonis]NEJ02631.1 BON domain-containing protein [Rhizobium ruizarguesonis]NEJ39758.1 BON domain-containing protein [Rhizobium ruizarguesonis]